MARTPIAVGLGTLALAACFNGASSSGPPGTQFDAGFDSTSFDGETADGPLPESGVADSSARDSGGLVDATADAAPIAWPDAGLGCSPPTGESGLDPTAAGLPANGLVLWLRGDYGVYTTASDAGATGDAGAMASVCAWGDVSGNGWVLASPSSTPPPVLDSAGVGGQPAVWMQPGTTLQIGSVLGIAPTSPRTLVAVEVLVNGDGRFNPIEQGLEGSPGTYITIDANTWETLGNLEGVYMTSNSIDSSTATSPGTARVHVFTVSSMTVGAQLSSSIDYRINGATQTLTVRQGGGTIGDFSTADFTSVAAPLSSSTGVPGSGEVAEVLVYDRALTLAERQAVETALEARYAIP